ncbi:MAG: phosphoglycerate dehydrogenase [Planctomycetota bacterium]|nr:phosphoglycerate dehydrogenase [Planctomycetota bacterium]
MAKIFIGPSPLSSVPDWEYSQIIRSAGHEVVYNPINRQLVESEVMHLLTGMDAVVAGSEPYTRAVLQAHPGLKVVARVGVGYDTVDVAAATELGKVVTIAPGTNHGSVAEHAFALMLAWAKGIVKQDAGMRRGEFLRGINTPLRGSTLGIAGLGRAGRAVAERALVFEMRVVAFDPYPDQGYCLRRGIKMVDWAGLLAESDWLSLHLPSTRESHHLMSDKAFAAMKRGAVLINTARGAVVDEKALEKALDSGYLGGACLDVYEEEPPGILPFFGRDNVVLTPHAAGVDQKSLADMAQSAAQAAVDILAGRWPTEKIVNRELGRED